MALSKRFCRTSARRRRSPAMSGKRCAVFNGYSQVFFSGAALGRLEAAFDQLRNAEAANLEFEALGVHLGKHEEIFGQSRQPAGMFENDFEETRAVLRIVDGAGEKRFGEPLDGGERSSEFVRDVGDKIAAHAFEFSQFGDVVEHDDGAGRISRTNGGNRDCKIMLPQRSGDDFRLHARLAGNTWRTASTSSVCRTTSTSALPEVGGTSRPRISANPGFANTSRSVPFTTATPSTMLPRIAEERLRSSVSVWIVRSKRAAVRLSEMPRASRASPEPSRGNGRKSPSATRRENSFRRSTRPVKLRENKREIAPAISKMKNDASHNLRRKELRTSLTVSSGSAKRKTIGEPAGVSGARHSKADRD